MYIYIYTYIHAYTHTHKHTHTHTHTHTSTYIYDIYQVFREGAQLGDDRCVVNFATLQMRRAAQASHASVKVVSAGGSSVKAKKSVRKVEEHNVREALEWLQTAAEKVVSKETYYRRPTTLSKETYYSVKRDLLHCQKRPTAVSKETYYSVKRDLLQCQKRPTTVSKETYYRPTVVYALEWLQTAAEKVCHVY